MDITDECVSSNLPTIDELIVAKKISIIERLTNSEKIQLFSDSLIRVINVEKKIKGWTRLKKQALTNGDFDMLQILSECRNATHYKYNN